MIIPNYNHKCRIAVLVNSDPIAKEILYLPIIAWLINDNNFKIMPISLIDLPPWGWSWFISDESGPEPEYVFIEGQGACNNLEDAIEFCITGVPSV